MSEHLKLSLKIGLYGGIVAIYLCMIGMVETFGERAIIQDLITVGQALLVITALASGFLGAYFSQKALSLPHKPKRKLPMGQAVIGGLLSGLIVGALLAVLAFLINRFPNMRDMLVNASPSLVELLTFGQGVSLISLAELISIITIFGLTGSVVFILPKKIQQPLIWAVGVVFLIGMLADLIRITMARPGWPTKLAKFLFAPTGLTAKGALVVFIATIIIILIRPYIPDVYRTVLNALISWLPAWLKRTFVAVLSFILGLRIIWFIAIDSKKDLALLPLCRQAKESLGLGACFKAIGSSLGSTNSEAELFIASLAPSILALTTILEIILAGLILVAAMLLIWRGIQWNQMTAAERQAHQLAEDVLYTARRHTSIYLIIAILLFLPALLGLFLSEVLVNVGLFVIMGYGLNIVVGFAGLLDLGYVAFFAVGAYTTAILTSPESALGIQLSFWQALPFSFIITGFAGILVGAPVLRLRGDYLAIVTLGLGEIARFLALSDWLKGSLGGAQGILKIPPPTMLGIEFTSPQQLYFLVLIGCLAALFVSWRLKDSRVGRAWSAMREDETVADVMGISTINYKLLAFAMGAMIASFSGAIFAAKLGSIFPHSFNVQVSITTLSLLIVGGLGSLPGVVVGALALVGVPELLREFTEYRLLMYGVVLIAMMILRPEGLLPSRQRALELHEADRDQDAWLKMAGVDKESEDTDTANGALAEA